jgi:hypothetical protein
VVTIAHSGSTAFTSAQEAQAYAVTVSAGAIVDVAGNAFEGLAGQEYVFTVVDSVAPTLSGQSPSAGETEVLETASLTFTFVEPVAKGGSGEVVLTPKTSGTAPVTIAIGSGEVSVSGSVVTVDPASDLIVDQEGQVYTVSVSSGAIVDRATSANAFAGVTYSFELKDSVGPVLTSSNGLVPSAGSVDVPLSTSFVLNFAEDVLPATGNLLLTAGTSGDVRTISVQDTTQVTFSGSVVTVKPSSALESSQTGQTYTLTIGNGVITDRATVRNAYAGLAGTAYVVTVVDSTAPLVSGSTPSVGANDVGLGSDLLFTFNEAVEAGTSGVIVLTPGTTGSAVTISATSGEISVGGSGNTLVTVNPASDLTTAQERQVYTLTMGQGVI